MIVVDASVLVDSLLHEGSAQERLTNEWICAPHLVDAEITSAIRVSLQHGEIDARRAEGAIEDFVAMDIMRYGHDWLLRRVWELRDNVTPYDALYVALAEALDEVLVTKDARLAKAPGIRARVEVIPLGA
jgi:predicted nucleic acid-binding protein